MSSRISGWIISRILPWHFTVTLAISVIACTNQSANVRPVRDGFISANDGAQIYYTIMGTGPDTLLAPAAVYLAADFGSLANGRTIIFYDNRSRGKSEFLVDSTRFGFYRDVEDMEAVRRALKINQMSVLGWSYLGGVVAVYASAHPEHVTHIIQVGPIAPRRNTAWNDSRQISRQIDTVAVRRVLEMQSSLRTPSDTLLYCRLFVRYRMLPRIMADTTAIARMKSDPCASPNERPERLQRSVRLALAQLGSSYDFRPQLSQVRTPVLIVWGDADQGPESAVREWVASWPNAQLLVIHGAGHLPWLEHPEIFFPAVDHFLRGGS